MRYLIAVAISVVLCSCVTAERPRSSLAAKTPPAPVDSPGSELFEPHSSHRAVTPEDRKDEPRWNQLRARIRKEAREKEAGVLFLGNSLTQGWRNHPNLWEKYFGPYHPLNAGIWSDGTQHLLWRLNHDPLPIEPRVTVLLIGANNGYNTPRQIAEGIAANIERIFELFPKTRLLLLGLFPAYEQPDARIRSRHNRVNRLLSALDGRERIRFLDFGDVFLEEDGTIAREVMHDFMHPTAEGYRRWGEAMAPALEDLWEQKK